MKKHIGLLLASAVFFIQAMLIPGTGLSWDEPASFFVGRANLKFWLTGNRLYVLDLMNKPLFADSPIQYIYGEDIYPPFPFVISSAFSYLFAESLHAMHFIDAHHLGEVFLGSIGVWAAYGLMIQVGLPIPAAIAGTLAYVLHPAVWGPMRNDAKDIPLMSMLVVSMYGFLMWLRLWQKKEYVKSLLWGMFFAVMYGLSGGTKPTAAILVPVITVWFITSAVRNPLFRKRSGPYVPLVIQVLFFAVLGFGVFIGIWPWLWDNPVGKLTQVFTFFKSVGYAMPTPYFGTMYEAGVSVPKIYPFGMLFIQTPPPVTFLCIAGFVYALYLFLFKKNVMAWLPVVWFSVTMARFLIPGVIIYASIRHFIDAMPAYFILVGFGAEFVSRILVSVLCAPVRQASVRSDGRTLELQPADYSRHGSRVSSLRMRVLGKTDTDIRMRVFAAIISIIVIHGAYISFSLYPFEMSYFNVFAGGLSGVAKHGLFDVGQAAGAKEAMEAIDKDSAGKNVKVYSCALAHIARFYTAPNVRITTEPQGADYTIIPNSPSWFGGALTFNKLHHQQLYTVARAGAEMFYVFKYTSPNQWGCGYETVTNYEYQ